MTVNGSAVMAMYTLAQLPLERGLRPCVDLAPLIPPGEPGSCKIENNKRGLHQLACSCRVRCSLCRSCRFVCHCHAPWCMRLAQPCAQPFISSKPTPEPLNQRHTSIRAGQKKVPKVYAVAVSPMRPNLAAVGANSGMAFLTFDRMYPLPVAALPPASLADAHLGPGREGDAAAGRVEYVTHMGDALWIVTCAAEAKVGGGVAWGIGRS